MRRVTGITAITAKLLVAAGVLGWIASSLSNTAYSSESGHGALSPNVAMSSGIVPQYFEVSQNYPNPFNASTNLDYDLPDKADVEVRIYNILGREVRRLVDRSQQPGSYTAHWDGTDDQAQVVPSGLYFLVLLADDNWAVRKMMLVK